MMTAHSTIWFFSLCWFGHYGRHCRGLYQTPIIAA